MVASSPRPHRRGRIETHRLVWCAVGVAVPPGLTAGGGLKRADFPDAWLALAGSPRPHRWGRIETFSFRRRSTAALVPPGLTAGGGLKQAQRASTIDA